MSNRHLKGRISTNNRLVFLPKPVLLQSLSWIKSQQSHPTSCSGQKSRSPAGCSSFPTHIHAKARLDCSSKTYPKVTPSCAPALPRPRPSPLLVGEGRSLQSDYRVVLLKQRGLPKQEPAQVIPCSKAQCSLSHQEQNPIFLSRVARSLVLLTSFPPTTIV